MRCLCGMRSGMSVFLGLHCFLNHTFGSRAEDGPPAATVASNVEMQNIGDNVGHSSLALKHRLEIEGVESWLQPHDRQAKPALVDAWAQRPDRQVGTVASKMEYPALVHVLENADQDEAGNFMGDADCGCNLEWLPLLHG